jgi:hypothetical protein
MPVINHHVWDHAYGHDKRNKSSSKEHAWTIFFQHHLWFIFWLSSCSVKILCMLKFRCLSFCLNLIIPSFWIISNNFSWTLRTKLGYMVFFDAYVVTHRFIKDTPTSSCLWRKTNHYTLCSSRFFQLLWFPFLNK